MLNWLKNILRPPAPIEADDVKWTIKKFLPSNPVIMEAGAHIGTDSIEMARIWPDSTVYAFEPVPHIFDKLKYNTRSYKQIIVSDYAVSDKDGTTEIFISSGRSDGSSSILKPKEHLNVHPDVEFKNNVTVKTITMESWAKKNNVSKIDCLWLDLQGFELQVLKHFGKILDTVKVIYSEVNLIETYKDAALYPELKSWLESKGFKVEQEYLPWNDAGNVLFTRK